MTWVDECMEKQSRLPTWYVVIERRWMPGKKYWRTVIFATKDRPYGDTSSLIACYEIDCTAKDDAVGAVVEWLAKGRPSAMRVREVVER